MRRSKALIFDINRTGARLGQGTGFDDLEWGILSELGIVDDKTVVATTVHDNQVLDMLPPYIFQNHDVPVDIICTPAQTSKFFLNNHVNLKLRNISIT